MTVDDPCGRLTGGTVRPRRWMRPVAETNEFELTPTVIASDHASTPDVVVETSADRDIRLGHLAEESRFKPEESCVGNGCYAAAPTRRVLHVGSGFEASGKLHPVFPEPLWEEVRLDVDPRVGPELLGSIVDMRALVRAESCDAVWCSHCLEHLDAHEVPQALREFVRVLKPDGFLLIRSPDLETVAELILVRGLDEVVYHSASGPITPLDMLYGHARSIARNNLHMRHGTGFTQERLGRLLVQAGFAEARTLRTRNYEVWGLACSRSANAVEVLAALRTQGLDFARDCEASG